MAPLATFLEIAYKKYAEATRFDDVESKQDPETEPFKSRYRAREIYGELKTLADEQLSNEEGKFILACLDLKLGKNYIVTDELSTGQQHLERCVKSLEDLDRDPQACSLLQSGLNQLGILWCERNELEKSRSYLERAKLLYNKYNSEVGGTPKLYDEVFQGDEIENLEKRQKDAFEDGYTHTLYYLAQVCKNCGESKLAAEYCHLTLQRQLASGSYDSYDWSINCATLSQFYVSNNNYQMARHCLAAASFIYEENLRKLEDGNKEEDVMKQEKIYQGKSDILRCWAAYGLSLLEYSRDEVMDGYMNENTEVPPSEDDHNDSNSKLHFNLELTGLESQITDKPVTTFDDARLIFLMVQKWLNESKEFYVIDDHCSDYVEIMKDLSNLYRVLAFFELDLARQCKMHKRRIDMLTETLKVLNPEFYLLICRQLMYEIAETYSHLLDLKIAIIEGENKAPSYHAIKKINQLAEKGIEQFQDFLNSMNDQKTKKLPVTFAEENERPALVAKFYLGRLYSKIIEHDIKERLELMNKTLQCYKYIIEYCDQNPDAAKKVQAERDVCAEMVELLPKKMDKMLAESQN